MPNLFRNLVLAVLCLSFGCTGHEADTGGPAPCSDEWITLVERQVPTSDSQGHGPDTGGEEWKSVVEFKLGIRGDPGVPDPATQGWCDYIDSVIRGQRQRH